MNSQASREILSPCDTKKSQNQTARKKNGLWFCLFGFFVLALGVRYMQLGSLGSVKYVVVFDAGSTGSRVHILHFRTTASSPQVQLLGDDFHEVKPGLSAYAGSPVQAAQSLDDLLKLAVESVPAALRRSTPCILRATAGLRLLEGQQSQEILDAVLNFLTASPFVVDSKSVSILEGQDEGAFAWLALNYLKGNLGKEPAATATTVDLGGGSVQVSYAVEDSSAANGPADYIKQVKGGGVEYNVYVHSYLGFGLMAARAGILEASPAGSACLPTGFYGQYSYGDKQYEAMPATIGSSASVCRDSIVKVLQPKSPCGAPIEQCSFNGAWGGPELSSQRDLYLFSYFWDRAHILGIIPQGAIDAVVTLNEFIAASNQICTMGVDEINAKYIDTGDDQAAYLCMDLAYCSSLLAAGFGMSPSAEANLVKSINYEGKFYEVAWALGAAINIL